MNIEIRRGHAGDLPAIARIQSASPEAAQWKPADYLTYDLIVADYQTNPVGFAVLHRLTEGESELLNLAIDPAFRRRGIGRRLLESCLSSSPGILWLEVRESNLIGRNFYKSLGFLEAGQRVDYYRGSGECAIVMNVHS